MARYWYSVSVWYHYWYLFVNLKIWGLQVCPEKSLASLIAPFWPPHASFKCLKKSPNFQDISMAPYIKPFWETKSPGITMVPVLMGIFFCSSVKICLYVVFFYFFLLIPMKYTFHKILHKRKRWLGIWTLHLLVSKESVGEQCFSYQSSQSFHKTSFSRKVQMTHALPFCSLWIYVQNYSWDVNATYFDSKWIIKAFFKCQSETFYLIIRIYIFRLCIF